MDINWITRERIDISKYQFISFSLRINIIPVCFYKLVSCKLINRDTKVINKIHQNIK